MFLKFIADDMLGKLARWLRVSGHDVLYSNKTTDDEIVAVAKKEGRIVLTRDNHLIKRLPPPRSFFISHDYLGDQLRQFYDHFKGLSPWDGVFTRCLVCNVVLEAIGKEKVKDRVWPYVFESQKTFHTCPSCNRIYWGATHKSAMELRLKEILAKKHATIWAGWRRYY